MSTKCMTCNRHIPNVTGHKAPKYCHFCRRLCQSCGLPRRLHTGDSLKCLYDTTTYRAVYGPGTPLSYEDAQ